MKSNVVTVAATADAPRQVFDIDVNDSFFKENGRLPFPEVAEKIEAGLQDYQAEVEEVTKKTNMTPDAYSEADSLLGDTAGLSSAIEKLPRLKERKKVLDMHTNIARELLKAVKARGLNQFWDLESELQVHKGEQEKGSVLKLIQVCCLCGGISFAHNPATEIGLESCREPLGVQRINCGC